MRLASVHQKVLACEPLDLAEVTALYASKDILAVGWLGNYVREQKHGDATRCVVNQLTDTDANADELVIPGSDLQQLCRAIESQKVKNPKVRIAAFTVEEIADGGRAPDDVCRSLRNAGADSLIGNGAELFLPSLRQRLWHHAGDVARRAEARQAAAEAGLEVPLYMIQREAAPEQQAAELLTFREMDNAASFTAVSFAPDASTSLHLNVTTGMQEMKQIAIARLVLANVAHIRAYWHMLGGKLLQISLRFGASELDGTPLDPGVNLEARQHELAREIQVAGREPHPAPSILKRVISA